LRPATRGGRTLTFGESINLRFMAARHRWWRNMAAVTSSTCGGRRSADMAAANRAADMQHYMLHVMPPYPTPAVIPQVLGRRILAATHGVCKRRDL